MKIRLNKRNRKILKPLLNGLSFLKSYNKNRIENDKDIGLEYIENWLKRNERFFTEFYESIEEDLRIGIGLKLRILWRKIIRYNYPIRTCVICRIGKNAEKIFKSVETKECFCIDCIKKYDLFFLLNKEYY